MIDGIQFKVCGLTSLVDAEFADRCGADYLGFILYPKSPRYLSLAQYRSMAARLPGRRHVAVMVEPAVEELTAAKEAGFDRFQLHFRPETPRSEVSRWSELVGADRLWLAPKLPPEAPLAPEWLPLAGTFLLDAFHTGVFGGSGQTGDWGKFARCRAAHPDKTWILAGGLNPDNVGEALRASGARFIDVNSGVESAPGVKDHAKLRRLVLRLHEDRMGGSDAEPAAR
jgi:phosphoribosylanthranilate isomerase